VCRQTKTLFTGSWDKSIYAVPLGPSGQTQTLTGHGDFVKCLLVTSLGDRPVLLSGGADASIIVRDISSTNFGKQLHKLKGHSKALQDLAIDPLSLPSDAAAPADSFVLFSASSDREIRRWHISLDTAHELSESLEKPICAHDTSVYRLVWDNDGDLWTASADKTVKHLVRSRDWEADTVLQHPDFVRDVLVDERSGQVVTACRDEEVRVWNASSGKLVCTYSGHYEEVTGLVPLGSNRVISVSIDGTVRQWGLDSKGMAEYQEMIAKEASGEAKEETAVSASKLTAEEEAELAELMDEDDD
jgi:WD40 repeat protein